MSEEQPIIDPQEIIDAREHELSTIDRKGQREGHRIGKRVLKGLKSGKSTTVVKSGRLGVRKTAPPPVVYEHSQAYLKPHGAEIEAYQYYRHPDSLPGILGGQGRPVHIVNVHKLHGRVLGRPNIIETPNTDEVIEKIYPHTNEKVDTN